MTQFLGYGNGSDGDLTISGDTEEAEIISSSSGTAGNRTLTVDSGLSFSPGQIVIIHQSRGSDAGVWELAQVESYSGTTLTLVSNKDNTYTDSGSDQAQVKVLKQYRTVTVSANWTTTKWRNGSNAYGIHSFLCQRLVGSGSGKIHADEGGFIGGTQAASDGSAGGQGEGTSGASNSISTSANGNGGGASSACPGATKSSGGGGGNGAAGTAGTNGSCTGGTGGEEKGVAALTTMVFGGGGGAGYHDGSGGNRYEANDGGGIVAIFAGEIAGTLSVTADAETPTGVGGVNVSGGGGGAGGSILIKTRSITATLTVSADGKAGNTGTGAGTDGQAGAEGRVRIETCSVTGSINGTTPTASQSIGGKTWCGSVALIM